MVTLGVHYLFCVEKNAIRTSTDSAAARNSRPARAPALRTVLKRRAVRALVTNEKCCWTTQAVTSMLFGGRLGGAAGLRSCCRDERLRSAAPPANRSRACRTVGQFHTKDDDTINAEAVDAVANGMLPLFRFLAVT